jgi:hypothetical protein
VTEAGQVTVDTVPLEAGCELTLTHEMTARFAELEGRLRDGWEWEYWRDSTANLRQERARERTADD